MAELTIHAINSMHTDETKDVVHIECTTDREIADLDVHSSALSALVLCLRQASEALMRSPEFSGQPLELTGADLVSRQDGTIMLELVFDGARRVVAKVPDPAIPALQECLFAMDELRRPMTKETTKH
jgi:hypothetical protein